MQECFGFRNFRQFERTRREIKLPYDLLNDIRFRQLPDAHKAHLICLLLLSARMNNLLPNSPVKLEQLIGATEPLDLSAFADFVENAGGRSTWKWITSFRSARGARPKNRTFRPCADVATEPSPGSWFPGS